MGTARVMAIDPAHDRTLVQVTVTNDMSIASLLRVPGNYDAERDRKVNAANITPIFQTVNMTVTYTEWYYGVSD